MDEKEHQVLEAQLADIDRERELLERVASSRPPDYRHDLDDQLTALWAQRVQIVDRLRPMKPHR